MLQKQSPQPPSLPYSLSPEAKVRSTKLFGTPPPRSEEAFFVVSTLASFTHNAQQLVFALPGHLQRLRASVFQFFGADTEFPNIEELHSRLLQYLHNCHQPTKIRLCGSRSGLFLEQSPYSSPWDPQQGITLQTFVGQRQDPEIKKSPDPLCLRARENAESQGAQESLLIDEAGLVKEGAWSNVFWFSKHGVLKTPRTKILPGITRQTILNLRPTLVVDTSFSDMLTDAAEVFVTQSTTGITPVVAIDGQAIGPGIPGSLTQQLRLEYWQFVASVAERIGGKV